MRQELQVSYQALNKKANQLARMIRARYQARFNEQLKPDTPIALYLDRGVEMVVSILAVLKAGAAYVPMSPEHPIARTRYLLEDYPSAFAADTTTL